MNITKKALFTLAALAITGCATTTSKDLDAKLAQEQDITTHKQLTSEATQDIDQASNLNSDQKNQLSILRETVGKKLDEITGKSLKLRSVLVKELLSPGYDASEVELIKSRLRSLENERLSVMFDGVEKANNILGHQARQHAYEMRELMDERVMRE